jgi:hypothetical protein
MTTGTFKYLDPMTSAKTPNNPSGRNKPWSKVDGPYRSFSLIDVPRRVQNMRSHTPAFTDIDVSGFALHQSPATETLFVDDATIRDSYYAEVETLLREKQPGVKKVVIFDHTIRRNDRSSARQPVQHVHVDQTPAAAEARMRRHVTDPAEAESLLRGRYQIVNVWRPIGHAAADFPLALVDYRSTQPADLVAVDLLYPTRPVNTDDGDDRGKEVLPDPETGMSTTRYEVKGETYSVAPGEGHSFWYVQNMRPDEALFIKCFDSHSEVNGGKKGVAGYTPHTAFVDPQTPEDAPGRQSIEVRCLVFYE